jgi:hypothetical protein
MAVKKAPICSDMSKIECRLDLVNRYNQCTGQIGRVVTDFQAKFLRGEMDAQEVVAYVRLTEYVISKMHSSSD